MKPYVPKTCCTTEIDWSYKDSEMCQTFQYGPPRQTGGQINHALYYRVRSHPLSLTISPYPADHDYCGFILFY